MEKMKSSSFSLGGISVISKVEKSFGLFSNLFRGLDGKAKDFIPTTKSLVYNKLTHSVSLHQMRDTYPGEVFDILGASKTPCERSFYRTLEKIGMNHALVLDRYQKLLKEYDLAGKEQFVDFSSSYFEGDNAELGLLGYSRDHRPGKKQVCFGISTGMNDIPTALTIQKGNTQDKVHMKSMLRLLGKVLDKNSLLIFDCGGNTKQNKRNTRGLGFHYLTLRAKKKSTYKRYVGLFREAEKRGECRVFKINDLTYKCVKLKEDEDVKYVFFSEKLKRDQLEKKGRKFRKQLEKNEKLLKKIHKGKTLKKLPSSEGWINLKGSVQRVFDDINNPHVTGIEGFFVLEGSVDEEPEKILQLYKDKDKAEKFIRDLKEGLEIRPIRHWNKWTIIGALFVAFLAKALISLTLFLGGESRGKNVKLLKKHLNNLTLTIAYPPNRFRLTLISNISEEIRGILDDFIHRFEDKTLELRW